MTVPYQHDETLSQAEQPQPDVEGVSALTARVAGSVRHREISEESLRDMKARYAGLIDAINGIGDDLSKRSSRA
jgi:hypothetical protein